MPDTAAPIRPLTALISDRGANDVNAPLFGLSQMQAALRKGVPQSAVLAQLQNYKGVVLLSSNSGDPSKFLTLHHFLVSRSAAAGGKPQLPIVYCCEGTEEVKIVEPVASMSGTGPRWPILQKSWNPILIPPTVRHPPTEQGRDRRQPREPL